MRPVKQVEPNSACFAGQRGFKVRHSAIRLMLWFKPSFKKKFSEIKGGWSTSQVLDQLGSPLEVEDSEVPLGSNWGSQPGMTFVMKPGDLVRQWMYQDDGEYYYLWFAEVSYAEDDPWRVTLKKIVNHRL
jgi:hypothetical protein